MGKKKIIIAVYILGILLLRLFTPFNVLRDFRK
jgi:hypothetical protein